MKSIALEPFAMLMRFFFTRSTKFKVALVVFPLIASAGYMYYGLGNILAAPFGGSFLLGAKTLIYSGLFAYFIAKIAPAFYERVLLTYELNRLLNKVDLSLLENILNEYVEDCGMMSSQFSLVPLSRVNAERMVGRTGVAHVDAGGISIGIGKIISDSYDQGVDLFLATLSVFIHEQVHVLFGITSEGVTEKITRDILREYVNLKPSLDESKMKELFDKNFPYREYVREAEDLAVEIDGRIVKDGWHALVEFLIQREYRPSKKKNPLPSANTIINAQRSGIY